MKINVSIEATPQEVREALGLPNIQKMQKAVMEQLAQQVQNGEADVSSLTEVLVPKSIQSMGKKFLDTALDNVTGSTTKTKKQKTTS